MDIPHLFIYSSAYGHLHSLQFLVIVKNAVTNIHLQVFYADIYFHLSWLIPRSQTKGSYANYI